MLLHISDKFTGGGLESFLENLCFVMSRHETVKWMALYEKNTCYDNINFEKIGLCMSSTSRLPPASLHSNIKKIVDQISIINPSVIFIHSSYLVNLALPFLRCDCLVYVVVHNTNDHISKLCTYNKYLVDSFICVSNSSQANLIRRFDKNDKSFVIENGIRFDRFNRFNLLDCRKNIILILGRLDDGQKNLSAIAETLRLIKSEFELVIIGDGPDRDYLLSSLSSSNIKYEFTGWASEDKVASYLSKAKVFFQPSHFEGLSIALIEAISAGLFPVVSKIPGSNDFVESFNLGVRCSPRDYRGFAAGIEAGLKDFNNNLIGRLKYARDNFDIEICTRKYIDLCSARSSRINQIEYKIFKIPLNYHGRLIFHIWSLLKSKIRIVLAKLKNHIKSWF